MFTKQQQKQFTKNRFDQLQKQLLRFCKKKDLEALHQFRVNVKKLKAYMKLLMFVEPDIQNSIIKKTVTPIYKHAGRIRTADLNRKLIRKYFKKGGKLEKKESLKIKKQGKFLINKRVKYRKALKKAFKKLLSHLMNINSTLIHDFYQLQISTIDSFCRVDNLEEYLHENRKEIKTLYYIDLMLKAFEVETPIVDQEYLHQLEEEIGEWHDLQDTINFLKKGGQEEQMEKLQSREVVLLENISNLTQNFSSKIGEVAVIDDAMTPIPTIR